MPSPCCHGRGFFFGRLVPPRIVERLLALAGSEAADSYWRFQMPMTRRLVYLNCQELSRAGLQLSREAYGQRLHRRNSTDPSVSSA